jgi:flagellar basal-body rod protein FlgF
MIYGLYLSAAGVVTSSYRQDVIANNLANAETPGFKRDVALFQQRLTEAQSRRRGMSAGSDDRSVDLLENLGGGILASPTLVDTRQGDLDRTGSPLDVAILGDGYFAVTDRGETRLTRNGRFMLDKEGYLVLSDAAGHKVLDPEGKPVRLPPGGEAGVEIRGDGLISRNGQQLGKLGIFDVPDRSQLTKQGGTLMGYPDRSAIKAVASPDLHAQFIESANVDPTIELAELMETQRQLEANANMIRFQDQTLQKLVNEVGKIG